MKDRLPKKPGRVELAYDDGTKVQVTITRKDEPVEAGMALNKANLLPDDVCDALGLDRAESTPGDALRSLQERPKMIPAYTLSSVRTLSHRIGDYIGKIGSLCVYYGTPYSSEQKDYYITTVHAKTGEMKEYSFTGTNIGKAIVDSDMIVVQIAREQLAIYSLSSDGASLVKRVLSFVSPPLSSSTDIFYFYCIWNGYAAFIVCERERYRALYKINLTSGALTKLHEYYSDNGSIVLYSYDGTITLLYNTYSNSVDAAVYDLNLNAITISRDGLYLGVDTRASDIFAAYDGCVWSAQGNTLRRTDISSGIGSVWSFINDQQKTLLAISDEKIAYLHELSYKYFYAVDLKNDAILSQININNILVHGYLPDFRAGENSLGNITCMSYDCTKVFITNNKSDACPFGVIMDINTLDIVPVPYCTRSGNYDGAFVELPDRLLVINGYSGTKNVAVYLDRVLLMTEGALQ